jgi:hypothetical protein
MEKRLIHHPVPCPAAAGGNKKRYDANTGIRTNTDTVDLMLDMQTATIIWFAV